MVVNRSSDRYEHEADRVAAAVGAAMQAASPGKQYPRGAETYDTGVGGRNGTSSVRHSVVAGAEVAPDVATRVAAGQNGGRSLPSGLQQDLGRLMGADFSAVKVHTGAEAAALSWRLGARAFTAGHHIYFGRGEYRPSSTVGRRLLAHELAHVMQHGRHDEAAGADPRIVFRQTSGDAPPAWCGPLMSLVAYEEEHGMAATLARYHPLNNDLLIPLNHDIPSRYGLVDVDWMLRLSYSQYHTFVPSVISPSIAELLGRGSARGSYLLAKTGWNALRSFSEHWDFELGSIGQEANWNAPTVLVRWIHGDEPLASIFRPAITRCP